MLSGKVLYKDFFEQKGLIAYVLYAIAWKIVPNSFHGIYLLEIIFATFYYIYTYKTLNILSRTQTTENFFIAALACASSYLSITLEHGAELEEFSLPFLAYLLFHFINYLHNNVEIKKSVYFIVGIHVGLIFWSKYLCLALHVIIIIYCSVLYVQKKQYRQLKDMLLFGFFGFIITSMPVLIYFLQTNSFNDMIQVYFIENIFGYFQREQTAKTPLASIILCLATGIIYSAFNFIYIFSMLIIGNHFQHNQEENIKWKDIIYFLLIGYFALCILISIGGDAWKYYFLPTTIFHGIILFLILQLYPQFKKVIFIIFTCPIILFSAWYANHNYAYYGKYYNALTETAQIVDQSESRDVLLLDSMDHGIWFLLDKIPNRYYFIQTNARKKSIVYSYLDEIKENPVEFVLLQDLPPTQLKNMESVIYDIGYELYYAPDDLPKSTPYIRLYKYANKSP